MPTPQPNTLTPIAFQIAGAAPNVAELMEQLRHPGPAWRATFLDAARALESLALASGDQPAWGILTIRRATPHDTPEQQDCSLVKIATLSHPITFARAKELVAIFQSDPHQTADYDYRIVPFEQMQGDANA